MNNDLYQDRENYNKGYMPEQEVQSYPNKNKTMSYVFRGRRLNLQQIKELYLKNLRTGEHFDTLVDKL